MQKIEGAKQLLLDAKAGFDRVLALEGKPQGVPKKKKPLYFNEKYGGSYALISSSEKKYCRSMEGQLRQCLALRPLT